MDLKNIHFQDEILLSRSFVSCDQWKVRHLRIRREKGSSGSVRMGQGATGAVRMTAKVST